MNGDYGKFTAMIDIEYEIRPRIGETLANYRHLLEGTGHFVLAREVELARLEVRQSLLQANVKAVTFQET